MQLDPMVRPAFELRQPITGMQYADAPRPFGLELMTAGSPVVDLSSYSYDPQRQAGVVSQEMMATLATVYNTTEDHQTWTDKD